MRILITGAGGMLGHDLIAAADAAGHEPRGMTRAELDITDPAQTATAIAAAAPDVVINCAAYTNVDGAEDHVADAIAVNGTGAGHVAAAAARVGAWTIQVSTDYVFDGDRREPYRESDRPDPISAYGQSKLDGERAVAREAPDTHTIARVSGLFGVHGASFPRTMLRLAGERNRLTVIDDQVSAPTFTGHLAPALIALAEPAARAHGVLHVAAAGEASKYAFARAVIAAAGADCAVEPTDHFPTPAQRPSYSVLRSERGAPELPDWREGMAQFLELIGQEASAP
jgi:dTDP-4-dehydrorhamnose reductase